MEMITDGNRLRREKKNWRQSLEPERAKAWSGELSQRLWMTLEEHGLETAGGETVFLCYAAFGNEACLDRCYERLLYMEKRLYFPKTEGRKMDFFRVRDLERDLAEGSFGIREPVGEERYMGEQRAVAFVPGVVFDLQGNRMGFGAGYYDRYLSRFPEVFKMGICYEGQLAEAISPAPWDVPMDVLVTESRVISRERSQRWN